SLSRRNPGLFWRDVLTTGSHIAAIWKRRGGPDEKQRSALADILNGAGHGLFRAADPKFQHAVSELRALGLPVVWRNRLATLLVLTLGHNHAARAADLWTAMRRTCSKLVTVCRCKLGRKAAGSRLHPANPKRQHERA